MRLKQGGFSLIELVVGAGILAGVGLLGSQLIRNQKVSQQRIDHDLEIELLHTKISDFFRENAKDCDATFRYHYNQTAPISAPANILRCTANCNPERDAQLATGSIVFAPGSTFGERSLWVIESFGALTVNQPGASNSRTNIMLLPVNYVHRTQTSRRLTKFVPIAMRFDSGGRFKQCVDASTTNIQNLERAACNALRVFTTSGAVARGIWNGDTLKCTTSLSHPDGNCPRGVYLRGVEKGRATRCLGFRDYPTSPPEVNAQNVFTLGTGRDFADSHKDLCSNDSVPRVYTNLSNQVTLRCR